MSLTRGLICLLVAASCCCIEAQANAPTEPGAAPAASAAGAVSATLRPPLAQIGQELATLNIRRWKAPNPVKQAAEDDIDSIQRDLNGTLAGLLQQADAAPGSIPAAFAVYRNVGALYDTLLRVVETANLAAPDKEAAALQEALGNLGNARTILGDQIASGSQNQQAELNRLHTIIAAAAAEPRAPVKTTVINDGPAPDKPSPAARKRHTTHKPSSSARKTSKPAEPEHPQ